jgi:hypothetical protein
LAVIELSTDQRAATGGEVFRYADLTTRYGMIRRTMGSRTRHSPERGVRNTLIDLGELPPRGQRILPVVARQPIPYRALLGTLTAVLLVLLGGAAYLPPPAGPTVIAAKLADSTFVTGDRLFIATGGVDPSSSAVQNKIVSAYALPAGTLLSQTTVAVTGAIFDVAEVADTILVTYQVDTVGAEATVALIAGTDKARWRHPARLLAVSPADGLVLLRENSPQSGSLHWYGVDLATGVNRWSLDQPVLGYTIEAGDRGGFPSRLVTAGVDGHLEVRDAVTGEVTAKADIQVPPDWRSRGISMWAVDDMVLVGGQAGTTAYALGDLSPLWRNTVNLSERYVLPHCGDSLCVVGTLDGVELLDPATGRERWAANDWGALDMVGRYLLADGPVGGPAAEPQAVLDPLTGHRRGDFGAWRVAGEPRPDGTVTGLHQRSGDDVVWFATLDPATLAVRVRGAAERVSGDCRTTTEVLVCRRLDASIGIWPLG